MPAVYVPMYTNMMQAIPTSRSSAHIAATHMISVGFMNSAANSGMTERMQSTVPIMLSLVRLSSISFLRSFTMPLTPYSVSNGSLSRNS